MTAVSATGEGSQVHGSLAEALAVAGLRVRRGNAEVLHGLSFSVARGRVVGLFGPSGCGKTTLMRALVGLQREVSGEVRVLGRAAGCPSLRREVGYMTQERSVYADLSVAENLRYFAALTGADRAAADAALTAVDLAGFAGRPVRALSGGQQVRVSLAAAMLCGPRMLVLDEPTVGLDPVLRRDLWALFRAQADAGRTLLVSSHVMDEARHCDELLLLREGRILWRGTPVELTATAGTDDLDEAFLALVQRTAQSRPVP